MNHDRLGNILLKEGLIDAQQLDFCLSVQKNNGNQKLGIVLSHYDFVDEASIAKALALQVGWQVFEGDYVLDRKMLDIFEQEFFVKNMVFPVLKDGQTVFVIVRADDTLTTDAINQRLNRQSVFYVGIESQLRKALEFICEKPGGIVKDKTQNEVGEDDLMQWVQECLNKAIKSKASDIHIEPSSKVVEIRFRIDGVMVFIQTLPLKLLSRLVNVVFHLAEVTISDFGHFHDAKFLHDYGGREIDIRVSHIPCVEGSSIVLRLLDKGRSVMELSELGYSHKSSELIQEYMAKPDGICLVVGPTGCGKTTTLYAILNHLKSIDTKILTIEDPVEIQLPLMTQVQINEKRGIVFSQAVRSFLRHDPDIILIGEIRDQLTAQEALRAAMTGHQVFSTLHTNKALDVFLRLSDLGVPLTHLADHLSMIISQRLVRKLCVSCKKSKKIDIHPSKNHKYLNRLDQDVFYAVGCDLCRGGYLGQTVVAEVLVMDEQISNFLTVKDMVGLKKHVKDQHFMSMTDDARRLIEEGLTSLEEIQRILG